MSTFLLAAWSIIVALVLLDQMLGGAYRVSLRIMGATLTTVAQANRLRLALGTLYLAACTALSFYMSWQVGWVLFMGWPR